MAVTTQKQELARLRSYLNPFIRGNTTTAVLNSLATASSYLVNSVQAVNDSLYVVTAQGVYLDLLLANYGISRDPTVGIGDEIFRTIGIQVKNRKQVRDLINNILDAVFGDEFVKATSNAQNVEPYALVDGDTLVINFDGANTSTITFDSAQFTNIQLATAQEVADAISIGLSALNVSGSAILNNDGNGNYVQLLSDTIGATSTITVLGGRAQNVLLLNSLEQTNGNSSTHWQLLGELGGIMRFTWISGADPNLGKLHMGDYVNIYGGGFAASSNQGTFPIVSFGENYFEVYNPQGTSGSVTQGLFEPGNIDNVVQFYSPLRETILSKQYYGAVYQTQSNILQIFMPATTQVVSKSRIGAAFLHGVTEQPVVQLIFPAGNTPAFPPPPSPYPPYPPSPLVPPPSIGPAEYFLIDDLGSAYQYYVWLNVSGGSNTDPAPNGFTGIEVTINSSDSAAVVANKAFIAISTVLPTLTYTVVDNVITMTVVDPLTVADAGPTTPTTLGPYIFDTQQGFVVGGAVTTLTESVNGGVSNSIIFTTPSTANATAGAKYTNNGQVFTAEDTIIAGQYLTANSTGSPSPSGTLTLISGSGDSTITFTTYSQNNGNIMAVVSSDGFPNTSGYLIIGYGTELQEGPIPYIAVPSSGTILISPVYSIQQNHPVGSSVFLVTQKTPITLPDDGSYYQPYLTDTAVGRVYAQNLIDSITAAGVTVIYTILYPNPIGLGGWENPIADEIAYVYGP
jgi:hypothetical protein